MVEFRTIEHDSEMMRLQLLGDPSIMNQLRAVSKSKNMSYPKLLTHATIFLGATRTRRCDSK